MRRPVARRTREVDGAAFRYGAPRGKARIQPNPTFGGIQWIRIGGFESKEVGCAVYVYFCRLPRWRSSPRPARPGRR